MKLEKLHTALCKPESRVGDFLEWYAGEAAECWCCSMLRGIALGAGIGLVFGFTVGAFYV